MRTSRLTFAAAILALGSGTRAQPLTVSFRNFFNLGTMTNDQNGQPFTVAGLSGIARLSGDEYWAVMDNSNKLVKISIQVGPTGTITNASILSGLTLDTTLDFEGIAFGVAWQASGRVRVGWSAVAVGSILWCAGAEAQPLFARMAR